MRTRFFFLCFLFLTPAVGTATLAGEPQARDIALAEVLPPSTLFFFERPASQPRGPDAPQTVMQVVAQDPEVSAFLEALSTSRKRYVSEVADAAGLQPAFVRSLLEGQLSGALVDVAVQPGGEGGADYSYTAVLAVHLAEPPDQKKLFEAIKTMVRRWREEREEQGTAVPLKRVAWEEKYPGDHTVLMIASKSPLRFVLLGRTLLFFRGPKSEGLKQILANYDNPVMAKVLAKSPLYQAVRKGAEAAPGMSYFYLNTLRLYTFLGAVQLPRVTRLLDVLGIRGVQALGCAGGYSQTGMRHTLYFHTPRKRRGLLKALRMRAGAENAAMVLPEDASGIFAARADLATLYQEIPLLVDAVEQVLGRPTPLELTKLAGQQTLFGVSARKVLDTLGDALIVESGPGGWTLRFDNANWKAFEQAIARMEQNTGKRFASMAVENAAGQKRVVRYFNRWDEPIPVAPGYSVTETRDDGTGVIYVASYPQALKAILRRPPGERLQASPDYQRVMAGMGKGYGVFLYVQSADSYPRVYDAVFLPALHAWRGSSALAPDPGILPPGEHLGEHFFGCAVGVKNSSNGIAFTAYSPLGLGGFLVFLTDKLLVSNPTAIGMIGAQAARYLRASPEPGPELEPAPGPAGPGPDDEGHKLPGIGGE